MKKGICLLLVIGLLLGITTASASWERSGDRWWYSLGNGEYARNYWVNDEDWYYFDEDGWLATGWKQIEGKWYYFRNSGIMESGWTNIDGAWYCFDDNGVMATGWQNMGGVWYYFGNSGAMATGWQEAGGDWYWFGSNGAMTTGWQEIDGKWYCFGNSGAMITGWLQSGNQWYYFAADGAMATGWQEIGGKWFCFGSGGAMATGWLQSGADWYYFDQNGAMVTGWLQAGDDWYYFGLSGAMVTGEQVIDGVSYFFDENGKLTEPETSHKVGISMPTKHLNRWLLDGENLYNSLLEMGYEAELMFADNDVPTQRKQIETMIEDGCEVLVITAIDGGALGDAMQRAQQKGVKVIAFDRLIMDTDAVDYYTTFDNYGVGTVQGNYVKEALDLDHTTGPYNVEFTAGDSRDNNAALFFKGAIDVLKPYIKSGKLVVKSGQTTFKQTATEFWSTDNAKERAEQVISDFYADGIKVDAWVCSNDSTALGVAIALEGNYAGEWPIITGQDCDIPNVQNIIAGKQAMSVFKDTGVLVARAVKMVQQILDGETVEVNDTKTYNNNQKTVPTFLCTPVYVDAGNYKAMLIDTGVYSEDSLK